MYGLESQARDGRLVWFLSLCRTTIPNLFLLLLVVKKCGGCARVKGVEDAQTLDPESLLIGLVACSWVLAA